MITVLLLTLIIVLLSIPLSMNFLFLTTQGVHGHIRFNWLFGLVDFQTQFQDQSPARLSTAKKASAIKSGKRKDWSLGLLKHSIFRRHIFNFIRRLLRATHAKNLYLKVRIGLGDPADTGALWAILGPVSELLRNINVIRLELEPEFLDATMELESHGHFRFIPLQVIILFLIFLLSPTTIRAWRLTQT